MFGDSHRPSPVCDRQQYPSKQHAQMSLLTARARRGWADSLEVIPSLGGGFGDGTVISNISALKPMNRYQAVVGKGRKYLKSQRPHQFRFRNICDIQSFVILNTKSTMDDRKTQSQDGEADSALPQLMSADRSALLDVIDQLRNLGINQYVDLPTILVCGDQSSGKSSVLEAICKLPFPKGDNVCTTFATELAIRRAPDASVSVWIQPADSRSADDKLRIANFQSSSNDLDHFGDMVKDAKAFLIKQSNAAEASYFEDVLHVGMYLPVSPMQTRASLFEIRNLDVSNPVWPPLTVVDCRCHRPAISTRKAHSS